MASTRREFVQRTAAASAALALPLGLAGSREAPAAGSGWQDADYWAFADRVLPFFDAAWSPARRYYSVHGGGQTSTNADLLYVHAAAARKGHAGPSRNDARARALAMRLLDDPPCRVPAGAARVRAAGLVGCHERARSAGDQTHDWGWGATMEGTGGQHVVIDTAVVRALAMAYHARRELGLTAQDSEHLREHVRAAAYNTFYFYPALRLNQINWPIEIYACAADVTGDDRLLRNDCRAQLSRFARALTHPVAPWRIPFTGAGYRWHYLPQYTDNHPMNLDSAEYATIVSQAVAFYARAREAGMAPLSGSERAVIKAWLERVLCGYWTHAGYLNWDTGLSFARWHQAKKHGLCLPSLMAIAQAGPLQPSAAHGRWAKYLFDRGLEFFDRVLAATGTLPPAVPFGVTATDRGDGDGELYAARMAQTAAQAVVRGLADHPAETPPPLYAYDPDIGRLAVTTPHYNTAILAVNRGAVPYGGMEPARLFDGDQRVAANIGGRRDACFGVVVTEISTGRRTETQHGRRTPSLEHPPLRLTHAPRGVGAHTAYPRHAYAGAFRTLEAEGWTDGPTVRVRSRHRFRSAWIESSWAVLPRGHAGAHRVHALFPSWDGAAVTVVRRDGSRRRLEHGKVDLADVARIELIGSDGGYVVAPHGARPSGRVHLFHPAPQSSEPRPGPTVAVELLDGGRLRRMDLTVRYAPARNAADAERVARRLRRP